MACWILWIMKTASAMAYEEVDDLVEIFATDGQFIAIVNGRRHFTEDYRAGETILWQAAKGEVGAFLTDQRLLAVSITSGQWNTRYLKINEKKTTPAMLIGAHLVILLSGERILAFGTLTDGFFQVRMPIGASIVAKDARGRVAGVVLADRALGFSSYRRGAAEIRFRRGEEMVSLKTTYTTITLHTNQRLISLAASDAVWRDVDLN
ncbi:MAG: hypothetical protein WBY88_04285 [Desulfosarcina sp.]